MSLLGLKTFRHGVHPPEAKDDTKGMAIRQFPFAPLLVVPLVQHAGKPSLPVVREGQEVARGQRIARPDGYMSVAMHAPASGTVRRIALAPSISGRMVPAVYLEPFPGSTQEVSDGKPCTLEAPVEEMLAAIQEAGVVGLGGAAFPTHVKLKVPEGRTIDTLILNGAECEPFLTTDHRVMLEQRDDIFTGIRYLKRITGAGRVIIGVESNKPDAAEHLRAGVPTDFQVEVEVLSVKYPQGAEKMLIKAVTGVEVPSGKLPVSVGVVVQNVGSLAAIAEVFDTGMPLIERIVTVTGHGLMRPANLIVPVGTRLKDLLAYCDGVTPYAAEVILGGPMMGMALANLDAPVIKGTTGVVVLAAHETRGEAVYPCIHCGRCLEACPVFLNPSLLGDFARVRRYPDMADHHLADCMLCGACSYVCPSNIPLSQLFQAGKAALRRIPQTGVA